MKKHDNQKWFTQKLSWQEAKVDIVGVAPDLAEIIDHIEPTSALPFIKVRYPFGAKIVNDGLLNLLNERGDVRPIIDPRLPEETKALLSYSLVPLGIMVKNGMEVFRELEDRVFSIATWDRGLDIGIWEYFGWTTPYSVTAGARSIYMLPRITLTSAHKRLKRDYNVTLPPPKKAFDHWALFKQIASSQNFSKAWSCDVIFFSKPWIDKMEKNKDKENNPWAKLYYYLVDKSLQHSVYGRRRSIFEIVWELFSPDFRTFSPR